MLIGVCFSLIDWSATGFTLVLQTPVNSATYHSTCTCPIQKSEQQPEKSNIQSYNIANLYCQLSPEDSTQNCMLISICTEHVYMIHVPVHVLHSSVQKGIILQYVFEILLKCRSKQSLSHNTTGVGGNYTCTFLYTLNSFAGDLLGQTDAILCKPFNKRKNHSQAITYTIGQECITLGKVYVDS